MKFAIVALAIIAAVYTVLILAPAILFYRIIFKKQWYKDKDFETLNKTNPYYLQYKDEFDVAARFICSKSKESFDFKTLDGTPIHGFFYSAGGDKTAIFLHGYNTPPLNNFSLQAKALYECGFNIVFICQRAHGKSGGTSTMGIKEGDDLIELLPFIEEKTGAKQILIYGMSMGCTALGYASERLDGAIVKGIVLDCGFTSPDSQLREEMLRRHLPGFLIAPLIRFFAKTFLKIDITRSTAGSLKKNKIPALFFHGGADITVPLLKGKENFNSCGAPKVWFSSPCAVHTLCYPAGGQEAQKLLLDFVKKYFK